MAENDISPENPYPSPKTLAQAWEVFLEAMAEKWGDKAQDTLQSIRLGFYAGALIAICLLQRGADVASLIDEARRGCTASGGLV